MPYEFQYYPAYKWTPAGEQVLCNSAADDDPSYLEHPPNAPDKMIEPQTKAPFTAEEMRGLLDIGHIDHDPNADDDTLRSMLTNSLLTAATTMGLSVPTDSTAEQIYAIMLANGK